MCVFVYVRVCVSLWLACCVELCVVIVAFSLFSAKLSYFGINLSFFVQRSLGIFM